MSSLNPKAACPAKIALEACDPCMLILAVTCLETCHNMTKDTKAELNWRNPGL